MRRLLVIGIGAGDPEHVTAQAVRALNEVDVFFVVEKGGDTGDLMALRKEVCERFIEHPSYRIVELPDPPRDRRATAYAGAVDDWRARRADVWGTALRDELSDDAVGGMLVWGDPSLYDSTIDVIERILTAGTIAFEYEVGAGANTASPLLRAASMRSPRAIGSR